MDSKSMAYGWLNVKHRERERERETDVVYETRAGKRMRGS
jgi:hypothetical protein